MPDVVIHIFVLNNSEQDENSSTGFTLLIEVTGYFDGLEYLYNLSISIQSALSQFYVNSLLEYTGGWVFIHNFKEEEYFLCNYLGFISENMKETVLIFTKTLLLCTLLLTLTFTSPTAGTSWDPSIYESDNEALELEMTGSNLMESGMSLSHSNLAETKRVKRRKKFCYCVVPPPSYPFGRRKQNSCWDCCYRRGRCVCC